MKRLKPHHFYDEYWAMTHGKGMRHDSIETLNSLKKSMEMLGMKSVLICTKE